MHRTTLVLVTTTLLALAAAPVAHAQAKPRQQAQILGVVQGVGETAAVTVRYVCSGGDHLWVSAKQSANGRQDRRLEGEGSSAIAAAWLQDHPATGVCDGRWRTQTFAIDNEEETPWGTLGFGALRKGVAWVQFCVTGEQGLLVNATRWAAVQPR
jgi:hypothetical protein